jgi:hypothetical protein
LLERAWCRAAAPRSRSERGRKGEERADVEEEIAVAAKEQGVVAALVEEGLVAAPVEGRRGLWPGHRALARKIERKEEGSLEGMDWSLGRKADASLSNMLA